MYSEWYCMAYVPIYETALQICQMTTGYGNVSFYILKMSFPIPEATV